MSDPQGDRLRAMLREQAATVTPAGDGLRRIQKRVARRRWRFRLLRPALATLTLAAVAGGVVGAQAVFDDTDVLGGNGQLASSATPSPGPTSPPPTSPPPTSPPPMPTPTPTATALTLQPPTAAPPTLTPMLTVWPYASRTEAATLAAADLQSGARPYLNDAGKTALRFAQEFLGLAEVTSVTRSDPRDPGIVVTLGRRIAESGRTTDVMRVFLVRATYGDDAPYVVVSASSSYVSLSSPKSGASVPDRLSVTGRVVGTDPAVAVLAYPVGQPGAPSRFQADLLGAQAYRQTAEGFPENGWTARTALPESDSGVVALVAVTYSAADGLAQDVAVTPVRLVG